MDFCGVTCYEGPRKSEGSQEGLTILGGDISSYEKSMPSPKEEGSGKGGSDLEEVKVSPPVAVFSNVKGASPTSDTPPSVGTQKFSAGGLGEITLASTPADPTVLSVIGASPSSVMHPSGIRITGVLPVPARNSTPSLDGDFTPSSILDAVGGHAMLKGGVYTMLCVEDPVNGPIALKPLGTETEGISERGQMEIDFYEKTKDTPIQKFIPKYFGIERRHCHGHDLDYLRIQNLLVGFKNPSVCDLKMGTSTCDPYASEEKRVKERNKYPQMEQIGFRFTGGKIWDTEKEAFDRISRDWAFSLNPEHFPEAIRSIFPTERALKLAPFLIERLEELLVVLTETPEWRIWSSSLLIVYESDDGREEFTRDQIGVWMIDFAHAYQITDERGIDDGYLFGVRNLISYLKAVTSESKNEE